MNPPPEAPPAPVPPAPGVSAPPERAPRHLPLVLACGIASFSVSAILVRYAEGAPGMAIAVWRTVFAVLLLAPVALPRIGGEVRRFARRDWLLIVVSGVVLGFHFMLWIESLYHTSVASASVLVTTSPLFIAALGFVFLRERLPAITVGAIVAAVAGAMVLGLSDAADVVFPRAAFGNALALSAAFLIAVYLLIGRVVRQRTSFLAYVFPLYSVVAATCLIAALVLGTPLAQPAPVLLLCLAMAVFPQIVGHGSWNYAVRYLPAALLGLLSLSEPVLATLMAAVLFGEIPSLASAVCMAVILAAIAMVFARRKA